MYSSKTSTFGYLIAQGIGYGIMAGIFTGIIVGIPLLFLGIFYGIFSGVMIGSGVGFINGLCLGVAHNTLFFPASSIADEVTYRKTMAGWMAIQTAVLTFIGAHMLYPELDPEFYAFWVAPLLGAGLSVVVMRRIMNTYTGSIRKKKRA